MTDTLFNNEDELLLCGFKIGDNYYSIPVLDVQEVIKPQLMTAIPLVSDHVRGLINLRGQIVTAVSLRDVFGLKDDLEMSYMNIIVKEKDTLFSLVVDEVLDVISVTSKIFEKTSNTLDKKNSKYINGVFKLDDKLLISLSLKDILQEQKME